MYFSGRVHSITYEDDTQAFYILQMVLDANTSSTGSLDSRVAVRGHVPGIPLKIGTWFGFEAEWKTHKKYGKQLNISRAPVLKNGWDEDTAARMLVSSGVGQRIVEAIQLHYPDDFLVVLENETRLQAVPAVDEFTALYIKQRWQRTRAYFQALAFIGDLGLPAGKVREVWSTFGDDAEKVLSTDPWRLVLIDGISFQQADEIAMRLGLDPDKPERVRGAVLYTARSQRSFGHLYLQTGQLFSSVRGLVQTVDKKTMAGALAACHKEGELVIDRRTLSGTTAVYEPWFWTLETEAASHLQDRCVCAAFKRGGLGKAP